jgi:glycosyltransferase involved in cell wall biosynthesis
MPKISIITVVRNGEKTIRDCIESINRQTVPVEHIIVDGASTDGTLNILKSYDGRISALISEPDNGVYDAMNKGLARAAGDVVGILNADDFYPRHDVLERVVRSLENSGVQAVYGDLKYVNKNDTSRVVRMWRAGSYDKKKLLYGWMLPHPTFFVRREVFERFGYFNTSMGSAADYELMLRFLFRYNLNAVYIPAVLVHMRAGGLSNRSVINRLRANKMDRAAWQVNGLRPYPWTLWLKPLRKIGQWVIR